MLGFNVAFSFFSGLREPTSRNQVLKHKRKLCMTYLRCWFMFSGVTKSSHLSSLSFSLFVHATVRQLSHQPVQTKRHGQMFIWTTQKKLPGTKGSNWSTQTYTAYIHSNPFWTVIMIKTFGSNVTPRLVLQGCYNQPDNEMSFKLKMLFVAFKTFKAIPSIDYQWWRSFT